MNLNGSAALVIVMLVVLSPLAVATPPAAPSAEGFLAFEATSEGCRAQTAAALSPLVDQERLLLASCTLQIACDDGTSVGCSGSTCATSSDGRCAICDGNNHGCCAKTCCENCEENLNACEFWGLSHCSKAYKFCTQGCGGCL